MKVFATGYVTWAKLRQNQLDSAKWYAARSAEVGDKISAITDLFQGDIAAYELNFTKALEYYHSAVNVGLHHDRNLEAVLQAHEQMIPILLTLHEVDSAIANGRRAFTNAITLKDNEAVNRVGILLASLFKERNQYDSAFYYQQRVIESGKKEFTQEKERQALSTYFDEKLKEQSLATEREGDYVRRWLYVLGGVLLVLTLLAIRYRIKLKINYEKKMKEIEMRALRAQMNPHFIFNCLGSINRYIVKSDTKTASQYLTKFSKLIRLILDNSSSDHISLEVEIQTLQLYLEMESLRFDHGFDYEIQTDEQLPSGTVKLPSMLIQPYVENAIWHGLLQKEEKGKLWIRFKKINGHILQAEIEDNGIGRKRAMELKSKGTVKQKSYGMQISSDRIQIINNLYKLNNSVTVHDLTDSIGMASGTKITLKIPVS
jgi:tetratricopeptide (TPR) repeat protein